MRSVARAAAARAADAVIEATVVLSFSRIGYLARRRLFGWDEPAAHSMTGQVVVVAGATGGLGEAIVTALARLDATVWLLGRDRERLEAAARRARVAAPGADLNVVALDLTLLSDVREAAETLLGGTERIDVLIHNAAALPSHHELTRDGLEISTQVNVVAPFLLSSLLLDRLSAAPHARVITVASGGMYARRLDVDALEPDPAAFNGVAAYAQTKRAEVVLTQEWARRASGLSFYATHPGWVDTPGLRASLPRFARLLGPVLRSPEQGADTVVWLATAPAGARVSGSFWHDRRPRSTVRLPWTATPKGAASRLWDWTCAHAGVASTRPSPTMTASAPAGPVPPR